MCFACSVFLPLRTHTHTQTHTHTEREREMGVEPAWLKGEWPTKVDTSRERRQLECAETSNRNWSVKNLSKKISFRQAQSGIEGQVSLTCSQRHWESEAWDSYEREQCRTNRSNLHNLTNLYSAKASCGRPVRAIPHLSHICSRWCRELEEKGKKRKERERKKEKIIACNLLLTMCGALGIACLLPEHRKRFNCSTKIITGM